MDSPASRSIQPAGRTSLPGWFLPAVAALAAGISPPALAGGGPENLFVVVNSTSSDSIAVANAFIAARGIPPINVFMLPWAGSKENVTIGRFREEILTPILNGIDARRLAPRSTASSTRPTSPGGSTTPKPSLRNSPKRTPFPPAP